MTERQERAAKLAINLAVSLFSVGILLYVAWPGMKDWMTAGGQWARYYRWRAWWSALPAWMREAAIVRGKGPAE